MFKQFGNVIEVRINPKNFGFIVFDSEESVQAIISARSDTQVMLHERRLNIEEKRPSYQKPISSNSSSGFGGGSRVFSTNKFPRGGGGVASTTRLPPRR